MQHLGRQQERIDHVGVVTARIVRGALDEPPGCHQTSRLLGGERSTQQRTDRRLDATPSPHIAQQRVGAVEPAERDVDLGQVEGKTLDLCRIVGHLDHADRQLEHLGRLT